MHKPNKIRDLALDGAFQRIAQIIDPMIQGADIQKRGEIEIHSGAYTVKLDGEPVCHVRLDGERRFTMTILCEAPEQRINPKDV